MKRETLELDVLIVNKIVLDRTKTHGCAMGSSASPVAANIPIFREKFEETAVSSTPVPLKI